MTELRPELEKLPARMRRLHVARGYPVPWFVAWVHGQGEDMREVGPGLPGARPEFPIMSQQRLVEAVQQKLCWVCGQKMSAYGAFVIGPMCAVNRVSAEPPSHRECAEWSARNCPFLTRPHAKRQKDYGGPTAEMPGVGILRNPGVAMVWNVKLYNVRTFTPPNGGMLFDIGEPSRVSFWCEGRRATRAEIEHSITTGLPLLRAECDKERTPDRIRDSHTALAKCVDRAMELLPAA